MTFLTGTGAIGTKLFTFSDADRLPDSLRDRSGVGWSPTPHAPGLGAPQRALDRKLWHFVVETSGLRCILASCILCWKRRRRRRRRLHMYCTDPARPPRDLGTTNRQDSTDAPAMAASSISRIKKINFFGPQEVSHLSLWTTSEPNGTQTAALKKASASCQVPRYCFRTLERLHIFVWIWGSVN